MAGLTLDAGALIAYERADPRSREILAPAFARGTVPTVPAIALAEVWRGDAKDARVAGLLKSCAIEPVSEPLTWMAGGLPRSTTGAETIDACIAAGVAMRSRPPTPLTCGVCSDYDAPTWRSDRARLSARPRGSCGRPCHATGSWRRAWPRAGLHGEDVVRDLAHVLVAVGKHDDLGDPVWHKAAVGDRPVLRAGAVHVERGERVVVAVRRGGQERFVGTVHHPVLCARAAPVTPGLRRGRAAAAELVDDRQ